MERSYKKKMIWKQILREREKASDALHKNQLQLYHPAFENVRSIMEELHILLTPSKEHKKIS